MLPVAYLLALSIVGETGVHAPARHGVFIVQGDTQIELAAQDVVQRNLVGYMTRILIGLEDRQTEDLPVVSESTTAICFGQLQSPSDWRVTRLAYSERYEDALIRRDPFNVNIWLPDEEVACDVKVTPGESDCYVLCPKSHLKPGLYCIHCCSLEPLTYVGTVDRQVFAFIVKEARKGTAASLEGKPVYCLQLASPNTSGCYIGSDSGLFYGGADDVSPIPHPLLRNGVAGVSVDQENTDRIVVLTNRGNKLLQSEDRGLTWKSLDPDFRDWFGNPIPVTRIFSLVPNLMRSRGLLVAAGSRDGAVLFWSADFGTTWVASPPRDSCVVSAVFSDDRIVFSTERRIYSFCPSKGAVSLVSAGLSEASLLAGFSAGSQAVLAVTLGGVVYESDDSLATFKKVGSLDCRPRYLAAQDSECWIADSAGIWRSSDRGTNWRRSMLPAEDNINVIVANTHEPGQLLAGGGKGLYVSTDGGVRWDMRSPPPPVDSK